jgi:hypothetical protein
MERNCPVSWNRWASTQRCCGVAEKAAQVCTKIGIDSRVSILSNIGLIYCIHTYIYIVLRFG